MKKKYYLEMQGKDFPKINTKQTSLPKSTPPPISVMMVIVTQSLAQFLMPTLTLC